MKVYIRILGAGRTARENLHQAVRRTVEGWREEHEKFYLDHPTKVEIDTFKVLYEGDLGVDSLPYGLAGFRELPGGGRWMTCRGNYLAVRWRTFDIKGSDTEGVEVFIDSRRRAVPWMDPFLAGVIKWAGGRHRWAMHDNNWRAEVRWEGELYDVHIQYYSSRRPDANPLWSGLAPERGTFDRTRTAAALKMMAVLPGSERGPLEQWGIANLPERTDPGDVIQHKDDWYLGLAGGRLVRIPDEWVRLAEKFPDMDIIPRRVDLSRLPSNGSGVRPVYHGDLVPPLGTAVYDPEWGVWAVRVRDEDRPFSCGFDCCGVAEPAVQRFSPEDFKDVFGELAGAVL